MRCTNSATVALVIGAAISQAPLASAVPIEARAGGLAGAFGDLIAALGVQSWKWISDDKAHPCSQGATNGMLSSGDDYQSENKPQYYLAAASDSKNAVASFCYVNNTYHDDAILPWTQKDIDVAKCITDLHHTQNDVCISVKGSKCDTDDYTANNGIVNNGAMVGDTQKHCGPAEGNGCRLDVDQASAIKNGLDGLLGQTMQIGHNDPYIVILNKDEFKGPEGVDSNATPQQFYQFNLGPHVGC